jgi:hypothetical protein
MAIHKRPDWATKLSSYLYERRKEAFSYDCERGLDCCSFTFGAIDAQTGINIGSGFFGTYRTAKESLRTMRSYCGRPSLEAAIEKLMQEKGIEECPVTLARRGDPILIRQGRGSSLGILDLNGRDIVTISNKGIWRLPLSRGLRAWNI